MHQDGKLETGPHSTALASFSAHGSVLMTLYTVVSDDIIRRHATVPFPQSYEAAWEQAKKSFARHLNGNDRIFALRHACKRLDGSVVWNEIDPDDWNAVLNRTGEEIGVFPQGAPLPWNVTYGQSEEILVFLYFDGQHSILRTFSTLWHCQEFVREYVKSKLPQWQFETPKYDSRLTGSAEAQAAHRRDRANFPGMLQNGKWTPIDTNQVFRKLVDLQPEPLFVYVRKSGY